MVSLSLVGLFELSEASALGINGFQVILEFSSDLVLAREDEHATDRPEHFLLTLRSLQLLNYLQGQFGLNLLAFGYLE